MEIDHAALLVFRTRYSTLFNTAFNLAAPMLDSVALKVDCGRVEITNHRWMKGVPGVREFIGARVYNNLDNAGFTVVNKKWEDTVAIKREDLERDNYGIYDPFVTKMAQSVRLHRDEIGFPLLSNALATPGNYLAYDGQAFFGNHTAGRVAVAGPTYAVYNNLTNDPLSEGALKVGLASMQSRRDDQGKLLSASRTRMRLMCAPGPTWWTANQLAHNTTIVGTAPGSGKSSATNQAAQKDNDLKGMFDVLPPNPYLSTSSEWYLLPSDPIFTPLGFQLESDVEFLGFEKFLHRWSDYDEFVLGTRALYNVFLALPEMCYGSTGTGK